MKIEKFNVAKFRNAELISLADDTVKIAGSFDWSASPVETLFTDVETNLEALKEQINKGSTVVETKEIREYDLLFNNSWRAAKYICSAFMLSDDSDEREAANVLHELAKTHGLNLHLESFAVQNTNARLYLNDCETNETVKAAITKLNFQPFTDKIKLNLDNLEKSIETRAEKSSSEYRGVDTKKIRKSLNDKLQNFFKYLEIMSGIEPEGDFADMVKLINESIRRLEHSIVLRNRQVEEEEMAE